MKMTPKYAAELNFWKEEINQYIKWFGGEIPELYGIPNPIDSKGQRILRHIIEGEEGFTSNIGRNALETWINADKWRYCKHLFVEPTYFSGQKILEVGCGPLGLGRFFAGATVISIDPLWKYYKELGYPTDGQDVLAMKVEELPYTRNYFDAAYSVNAIDHVDDFALAIKEIERVVKPTGEIRIEVHYHEQHLTEPCVLNDEIVKAAFGDKFDMQRINLSPSILFYPPGTHPTSDRFALWSNRDYLYNAVEALK